MLTLRFKTGTYFPHRFISNKESYNKKETLKVPRRKHLD